MVSIGDTLECAIWLTGMETEGHLIRWKEIDCPNSLKEAAQGREVLVGPIAFTIKRPGEDRVPPVPDHIEGPDVRLLVAEATVVGFKALAGQSSFLLDLEQKDVERLREITRKAHGLSNPRDARLSDTECDYLINAVGPEAALAAVREAVDARRVN